MRNTIKKTVRVPRSPTINTERETSIRKSDDKERNYHREISSNKFRAPAKKFWVHIGPCEKQTARQIKYHISEKWPNSRCEVTKLKTSPPFKLELNIVKT